MVKMVFGKENVQNSFDYLIDSDAFVGMFLPSDALHDHVKRMLTELRNAEKRVVTTNWVVAETATVLSNRDSQKTATNFLSMIEEGGIPILHVTPELELEVYRFFREQKKKGISMVDSSNVVIARHYGIDAILSFDKFYAQFGYQVQKITRI